MRELHYLYGWRRTLNITLMGMFLFALCGCQEPINTTTIYAAGHPFAVEIADTPELRRTGLMFRESMANNSGMLFIFDKEKYLNFWMKNTFIPLSIAFISHSGEILEIYDMQPHDTRSIHSQQPVMYALEVNQGVFRQLGIQPGQKITFPWHDYWQQ